MRAPESLLAGVASLSGGRLPLPEYRQIELYSKPKKLRFAPEARADGGLDGLLAARIAFHLLDDHFAAADPELLEGLGGWERYLALPRRTTLDKVIAEIYRILRICQVAGLHPQGHREAREGLIRLACDFKRRALDLKITAAGLELLAGAAHYYLDVLRQPYPEAYVEAMLLQYFFDIVGEIRKFSDEDRVLYQFRQKYPFNRHFRFDCDNPRVRQDGGHWRFEIGAAQRDAARYPIDFYLLFSDALYIVPVEALREQCLSADELARWEARTADGALPAHFVQRFGREEMVVGQPMT